jgi:anaphase-promoting complex subunit 6
MTGKSDIEIQENENEEKANVMDILYKNEDQDLMKMEAEKYFIARDYTNTFNKLRKINEEDFYNLEIIPMLCSCMIELNKVGELYSLAYKLANNCGDKYISWYAVGCYYYSIKKYDLSRKYFLKCNQLNKNFPEGWIALGNSYAGQDESDQALNAYRTCLRLFPGCHYSNLYIGMEFIRTNNFKTAFITFQNALLLSINDPLIYNEIGVVYYKQKQFEDAEKYFLKGVSICNNEDRAITTQTLLLNLGHCYKKMKRFKDALQLYIKLYCIDSRNIDVLNAIGTTLALLGNNNLALEYLHKANFIKSNDNYSIGMINKCINNIID